MSVVANVAINVDASKAVGQLNAVNNAVTGATTGASKMQQAFGGLGTAIAALGLGALVKDVAGAGIESDRTAKRIQNLAGANGEAGKLFAIAGKAAKEFGLSNTEAEKGVADLYGRLRPAGIALSDIETVYNGVNKAALAAGLTNADTSGVFLQLSQALGSGALQGDELRSIMEQMPAVGQAVAKVMGVTVGEVKKLGSEGNITTEVMIKAAAELDKLKPPPPDAFKVFNAEMQNLRTELGENILPIITPFVQALVDMLKAFSAMPEPLQTAIVALGLVATALLGIRSAWALLAPVVVGIKGFFAFLGGLKIAALVAGWAPALIVPFKAFLAWIGSTLVPGLLAFFSGPVGWTVLAVAAVVAMVVLFRKPIMKFFSWLGGAIKDGLKALWQWGEPIRKFWQGVWDSVVKFAEFSLQTIGKIIGAIAKTWYAIAYQVFVRPWINLWEKVLRDPVTDMIRWIQGVWKDISEFFDKNVVSPIRNAWDKLVDFLSKTAASVGKALSGVWNSVSKAFNDYVVKPIQTAWSNTVKFFQTAMNNVARGVTSIWTSMIGNIKNAVRAMMQYIANQVNKVAGLVNNLIVSFNKLPGPDIPLVPIVTVPTFAEGGYVNRPTLAMVGEGGEGEYIIPESKMAAAASNYLSGQQGGGIIPTNGGSAATEPGTPQITIKTGPVLEFNGEKYVTLSDMQVALRDATKGVMRSLRTPSTRYSLGIR